MAERRSLREGLKPASDIDRTVEEKFVFADKANTDPQSRPQAASTTPTESRDTKGQGPVNRAPFTTRLRADFAEALKRASLERQLNKQFPNTLQDMLEEALEPWLRTNGYLP